MSVNTVTMYIIPVYIRVVQGRAQVYTYTPVKDTIDTCNPALCEPLPSKATHTHGHQFTWVFITPHYYNVCDGTIQFVPSHAPKLKGNFKVIAPEHEKLQ